MNHCERLAAAIAAVVIGFGLAACAGTEPSAPSTAPPCAGVATTDYGLGNAVRDAAIELASLPNRFSTGTGLVTVVAPDSNGARLEVEVHLCGPGASPDQTRDAASIVARRVAAADTLGTRVARVIVVNPPASQAVSADPFDPDTFLSDTPLADLRSRWQTVDHDD